MFDQKRDGFVGDVCEISDDVATIVFERRFMHLRDDGFTIFPYNGQALSDRCEGSLNEQTRVNRRVNL